MAGYYPDRFLVAFALPYSFVQQAGMTIWPGMMVQADAVSRLHERPLQVVVRIRTKTTITDLASAGMNTWSHTTVRCKSLGTCESAYLTNFLQDHNRQDKTNAGYRLDKRMLPGFLEQLFHPYLNGPDILFGILQMFQ